MLLKRTSVLISALAVVGSAVVVASAPASADPAVAGTYNALTPTRIVNTVAGTNVPAGAIPGGGTISFDATTGLGPSASIAAVDLTITAISPTQNGYLTAYSGSDRPGVASVTFTAGESVPNSAVVSLDDSGMVTVYNGSPGTVQLAVDRSGYWTAGEVSSDTGGAYVPVTPSRVVDSRADGGSPLAPGTSRAVAVPSTLPADVAAVVVNVGAVAPTSVGYLTATGAADDQSSASRTTTVTFSRGRSRLNLAYVPVNSDGTISLYNGSTTPLAFTVDIFGYLTGGTPSQGGSILVTSAERTADSRSGAGPLAAKGTRKIQILPSDGPTTDIISAVVLHVTATGATAPGYLTAWDGTSARPTTSVTNFTAGTTRTGTVIVPLASDGSITLYNASTKPVGYVVDRQGLVVALTSDAAGVTPQRIAKALASARAVAATNLRQK